MKRLAAFLPPFLALVAIVSLTVGLILPTFRTIQETRAATIAEREQLERRFQRGRARTRATLELAEREQALDALTDRIPSDDNALAVVRSIESIAARHQLEERIAIDWSVARSGQNAVEVPTTIELSGTYPSLLAALRDLERLPLPITADRIEVAAEGSLGARTPTPRTRAHLIIRTNTLWRVQELGIRN